MCLPAWSLLTGGLLYLFFVFRQSHAQLPAAQLGTIQCRDSTLRAGGIGHGHKALVFTFAGLQVGDNSYRVGRAMDTKHLQQADL